MQKELTFFIIELFFLVIIVKLCFQLLLEKKCMAYSI